MARLRHIAVVVKDLDKAAEFYSQVFEFKKIGREDLEIGSAIYMSDGVINMALLNFCLLYTSPSPRDGLLSRMPSSA